MMRSSMSVSQMLIQMMRDGRKRLIFAWVMTLMVALSVASGSSTHNAAQPASELSIDQVFFAQQHVLPPDSPHFKLVSNLNALIKVHLAGEPLSESPEVFAKLKLNGKTKDIPLSGPKQLPARYSGEPALRPHTYDDSFTAMLPAAWIQPGLSITLELKRGQDVLETQQINDLQIGSPNPMTMVMYDIHYFGLGKDGDYPEGWEAELAAKLPVSKLNLRRVPRVTFKPLVMPPRGTAPSIKVSSPEEYQQRTAMPYDGEQGIALRWNRALKQASGAVGPLSGLYHSYINIHGVPAGGQAGGFQGVGSGTREGVLIHELGHTFGLPDGWRKRTGYPYHGTMYGIQADGGDRPHAGPVWAFDLNKQAFIPATAQPNKASDRNVVGYWKLDPMAGGGWGDQEQGFIFRHYSDFSVHRIRNFMEQRSVHWDEKRKAYVTWDPELMEYARVVDTDGLLLPTHHDVEVKTILFSVSGPTPEARIVYPPIGPYLANLIPLFDPKNPEERHQAQQYGYSDDTCNVTVEITQGGRVTTSMAKVLINKNDDPFNGNSLKTYAINVPADAGPITQVKVLYTPKVVTEGLTDQAEVLCSWNKQ